MPCFLIILVRFNWKILLTYSIPGSLNLLESYEVGTDQVHVKEILLSFLKFRFVFSELIFYLDCTKIDIMALEQQPECQ